MPRAPQAEELPDHVEELLGFLRRHLASELGEPDCPAPLAESLRVYTRAVIAATRDAHEHLIPVVEVDSDQPRPSEYARPTLPTEPPVSYDDKPPRRRSLTARGGWRVE